MKEIDGVSKSMTGQTQNVSVATEEQLASMEETATYSQALSTLAKELQMTVTQFYI